MTHRDHITVDEEEAALKRFKAANGRSWKRALNLAWMNGRYPATSDEDIPILQRIRNQRGPSWLQNAEIA